MGNNQCGEAAKFEYLNAFQAKDRSDCSFKVFDKASMTNMYCCNRAPQSAISKVVLVNLNDITQLQLSNGQTAYLIWISLISFIFIEFYVIHIEFKIISLEDLALPMLRERKKRILQDSESPDENDENNPILDNLSALVFSLR